MKLIKRYRIVVLAVVVLMMITGAAYGQRLWERTAQKWYPAYGAIQSTSQINTDPRMLVSATLMTGDASGVYPVSFSADGLGPTLTIPVMVQLRQSHSTATNQARSMGTTGYAIVTDGSTAVNNITTNTDTLVSGAQTMVKRIVVNVAGTTSTIAFYDKSATPCNTGYRFTLPTTAVGLQVIQHHFTNGMCVTTAGGVAADVSVLY